MKITSFISFVALLILCTGCPEPQYLSSQKQLEDNNMDFPNLRVHHYKDIKFNLSDLFDYSYYDEFVLTDDADTKSINELDIYFSVERFSTSEAELIKYEFDEDIDLLNAVHDNYIIKRLSSLYENEKTIKKEVPESVAFEGFVQVVHGDNYSYDNETSYFTATIEVGKSFYVFQLIGKRDNMGYLYDDFIDLLASVRL